MPSNPRIQKTLRLSARAVEWAESTDASAADYVTALLEERADEVGKARARLVSEVGAELARTLAGAIGGKSLSDAADLRTQVALYARDHVVKTGADWTTLRDVVGEITDAALADLVLIAREIAYQRDLFGKQQSRF